MGNNFQHPINVPTYLNSDDPRPEFLAMEPYLRGLGFDLGPGSNRLSPTVLCSDWYPHPEGIDLVWNMLTQGSFPFSNNTFDFVFASHVLEDFPPDKLQWSFDELMRMIKPGGYFVILGPYMDGVRYARWDEKFTSEHEEVKSGKRQVGETIGNPSHLFDWNEEVCYGLMNNSKHKMELVQIDTLPKNQMTIDFVVKKL